MLGGRKMAKKKRDTVEFRFYEMPQGEAALVMYGQPWVRIYGHVDVRLHFHNFMEIGICRYGKGIMYYEEEAYRYEDGMITIIPENFPHNTVSDGETENFWEYVFIDLKAMVGELYPGDPVMQNEVIRVLNAKAVITDGASLPVLTAAINDIIREASDKKPMYRQQIRNYVRTLVVELIRCSGNPAVTGENGIKAGVMPQISAALMHIETHYDTELTTAELANTCGLSETHFRRIFSDYIKMSPMEYVNLTRVIHACEIMKKSSEPMDVVAQKCGFTTVSTFNRNFRKLLDISPYQWKINPSNYENRLQTYKISALRGW